MPVSQELNSLIPLHDTVLQLRGDREEEAPRSEISPGRTEVAHQQAVPPGMLGRIVQDTFTGGFSGTHKSGNRGVGVSTQHAIHSIFVIVLTDAYVQR